MDYFTPLLKKKLAVLENMYKHSDSITKKIIEDTVSIINDYLYWDEASDKSMQERFYQEYLKMAKYKHLYSLSELHIFEDNGPLVPESELTHTFSQEELFTLTHDFYLNATNKEIFRKFNNLYKQRKKFFHLGDKYSEIAYADSVYLPYFNEVLIRLFPKQQFADLPIMIHEYGHGIQFTTNFDINFYDENYAFSEIISLFFERLSFHYFAKDPIFYKKATLSSYNRWQMACLDAIDSYNEIEFFGELNLEFFDSLEERLEYIKMILDYKNNYNLFDAFLDSPPSNNYIYIIGSLISVKLLKIYFEDKDKALFLLQKIMEIDLKSSKEQYLEELKKLGVFPTDLEMQDYNKHIKKELKLLT